MGRADKLQVELYPPLFAASLVLYASKGLNMHRNNRALNRTDPGADLRYVTVKVDGNGYHLGLCSCC